MTLSNTVHIIIVNWNGIEHTIECLNSIRNQQKIVPFVHLWDNNSKDEELNRIKKKFGDFNIQYYSSEINLGYTVATNKILENILGNPKLSPSEYIALINNDTVLDSNWLNNITLFARTYKADVVSSQMLKYENRREVDNLGHKMLRTGEIVPLKIHKDLNSDFTNFGACAGGALVSRKCLEEIGYFDTYFNTGYEDAEFGFRAKLYGYKTMHCNEAIIYHKGGESIKKIFDNSYAIKVQKDILYTMCKLYPPGLLLVVLPYSIMRNLLMGVLAMLFGKFNYIKILFRSTIQFLTRDFKIALKARKCLNWRKRTINSLQLFSMQRSSLIFDLKRVYNYLVLRKKSSLDQYR